MPGNKNYRDWMSVKADINNEADRPIGFKDGEIWVCSVGENIGYENDGKGDYFARPVLILKNTNGLTCFVIPLSTTKKRGRYHYAFDGGTGSESVALLGQLRLVDSSRLYRRIGKIYDSDFVKIRERIREILGL
jgi:mRNA interferase MazF